MVGQQSEHTLQREIKTMVHVDYLLYLPQAYDNSTKQWPLMLFLHGAGERGDDLNKVKIHGPPKLIEQGQQFPFIIVSPQCPPEQWWSVDNLDALLKQMVKDYDVDENRIYVTGLSMGGYGTWNLAFEYPNRFAAIAPICGGGDTKKAHRLKHLPVWVFHGAQDKVVPVQQSEDMVKAIKLAGGKAKLTIYPQAGHDSWTETYNNPALYEWFLSHTSDK
ncbi:MAG: prolyl oligopeptidase family serine peptidase [Caldithrix sp.]|nr:prolyl oligopeptidase family serine peptidase [Caldithrix sp.]